MEQIIKDGFMNFIATSLAKDVVPYHSYKEAVKIFAEITVRAMPIELKKDFLYNHFDFVMEVSKYDKFHGYFNEKYFTEYDSTKRDKLLDNAIYEYLVFDFFSNKHLWNAVQLCIDNKK